MKPAQLVALFAMTLASLSMAKVTGDRAEVLGTDWDATSYGQWLEKKDALYTPELSNLAVQSCLRDTQEQLDVPAYKLAETMVSEMSKGFAESKQPYGEQMRALTQVLQTIIAIPVEPGFRPSPSAYMAKCKEAVTQKLSDSRATLIPLYTGRMHPRVPEALREKGLKLSPLTWDGLRDSICELEGYYSTSNRPELWKFFSVTRTMANVLPAEGAENDKFVKTLLAAPGVVRLIGQINEYSSVAGKYNGGSIGMSEEELRTAPERLTGPALGSKAVSLMAFFTTGWREQLQKLTMERPYPAEAFQLLSAEEVMRSVQATADDKGPGAQKSQTELGMNLVWSQLAPFFSGNADTDAYGDVTAEYRKTAGLAWLALNAETNIRQNEKLPGVEATAIHVGPNPLIYGAPEAYQQIAKELDAALGAYRVVQKDVAPYCVQKLQAFAAQAAKIESGTIDQVEAESTRILDGVKLKAVIADIGQEVKDDEDGVFRLHLAIGQGHQVETEVAGQDVTLWTPSAMVLHLSKITSTAEWQNGLVDQYDPREKH